MDILIYARLIRPITHHPNTPTLQKGSPPTPKSHHNIAFPFVLTLYCCQVVQNSEPLHLAVVAIIANISKTARLQCPPLQPILPSYFPMGCPYGLSPCVTARSTVFFGFWNCKCPSILLKQPKIRFKRELLFNFHPFLYLTAGYTQKDSENFTIYYMHK